MRVTNHLLTGIILQVGIAQNDSLTKMDTTEAAKKNKASQNGLKLMLFHTES